MTKCFFQLLFTFLLLFVTFFTASAQQTVVDHPADSQLSPVLDFITIENGPPVSGLDFDSYYQLNTPGLYRETCIRDRHNIKGDSLCWEGVYAPV